MSTLDFNGQVIIVTGAGGALGRSHAMEFARRGAAVVANDLGGSGTGDGASPSAADKVAADIIAAGGKAIANHDSVATRVGGQAIIDAAIANFGRVDAVVNNAGFLRNQRFEDMGDAELDSIIDVHLKAAFYVTQPAYRHMMRQGYGRIVFTSSGSGVFGSPEQSNYGAAKAGLLGLMQCVALEGRRYGIHANAVLPTANSRLAHEMSPQWYAQMLPDIAELAILGPTGEPSYVTPLVVYLASQRCIATQRVYSATGGRFARVFSGVAHGWFGPMETPPTAEHIDAHWAEIEALDRYLVPVSVTDETRSVARERHKPS